jgi:crossover junction endodeoxyribonuclease RuvC
MKPFILGIDPGLSGALALRIEAGRVQSWQLPTRKVEKKNGTKTVFDAAAFRNEIGALSRFGPIIVAVEKVGGLPRDGAAGAFNFGMTCGRILEILDAAGCEVHEVPPVTWRGKMGVHAYAREHECDTKSASRAVASRLFPDCANQWAKKTHDGCAEAAIIAEYVARHVIGSN